MLNVEDAADLVVVVTQWAKSDTGLVQAEHVTIAVFDLISWSPVETNKHQQGYSSCSHESNRGSGLKKQNSQLQWF